MELTFIAGVRAGEHLHLAEPVITIGRELDNLVLMPVDGVSRHHAEIRSAGPDMWEVCDLGSTNGVTVNRQKINGTARLQDGDIIEICNQSIMVNLKPPMGTVIFKPLNEMAAALTPEAAARRAVPAGYENPAPIPTATPLPRKPEDMKQLTQALRSGKVELFKGPPETPRPAADFTAVSEPAEPRRRRFSNLFFYILVFAVAVIIIGVYLIFIQQQPPPPTVEPMPQSTAPGMVLWYERERIEADNVFRYSLLFEGDHATFTLDDLRSRRSFQMEIPNLSEDTRQNLLQAVERSGFYDLPESPSRAQSLDGRREKRHLLVVTPERRHEVMVNDDMPPDAFTKIEILLQNFAEDNKLSTISLTPEELKAQAEKAYQAAENYFANSSGNPANLPLAIRSYELAAQYLEQFSPKPDIYRNAMAQLEKLRELRDNRIRALKTEIQNLSQLQDFTGLRQSLLELQALSEPGSRDYDNARKGLLTVEEQLRNQQRR